MWLALDTLTPSERRRVQEEKDRRKRLTPVVIVGYTGTREGMTPQQREAVRELLQALKPNEGHHGDCIGGDEQFHGLCGELGIPVVIHPPKDARLRAYCKGATRIEEAKEFLDRNKDIVKASTNMVATPKETKEPAPARGQGTWSTIRYARNRECKLKVIMPNGG